jgi:hypothetical protein
MVLGPERDEVAEEWRRLHKEQLCDLYSLPDIIRLIKSRRVKWVKHVTHMRQRERERRCIQGKILFRKPRRL